ncbi:MAG: hypothetical protein ACRDZR_10545 [Acidimicrobiales bacterium]
MDVRQLVESLVSSLAWPVAIVVVALLFRPLLVQRLRPRLSQPSAALALPEEQQDPSAAFTALLWKTSGEMVEAGIVVPADAVDADLHREEMEVLYALSPSAFVVQAHDLLHRTLLRFVLRLNDPALLGGGVETNTMALARVALARQLIDEPTLGVIEKLTYLRGLATNRGGGEVNIDVAMDYASRIQAIVYRMEHPPSRHGGG